MVGDLSNKEREGDVVAITLCTDKNYFCSYNTVAVQSPDERSTHVRFMVGAPIYANVGLNDKPPSLSYGWGCEYKSRRWLHFTCMRDA